MSKIRTHYDNLKVARNAPDALIKAAYKVLLQQNHPDKVEVSNRQEALRITKIIRNAYDVLSDPVQRAEHDAWIIQETQSRSHKPEQPDIDVNDEREKEEDEKQRKARKNEDLRREKEAHQQEIVKKYESRLKENLKRKEAEQAKRNSQTGWDDWVKAEQTPNPTTQKTKNKTSYFPWIIGLAGIYFFIVTANIMTDPVNQIGIVKQETPGDSTKANGYHDNGDGTVKDLKTNLEWMRCSLGQNLTSPTCKGEAKKYNWDDALAEGKRFEFAGHSDWRVPTIDELKTLVYCSSGQPKTWNDTGDSCKGNFDKPTIASEIFPNTSKQQMSYWSSSPSAFNSNNAWHVDFGYGDLGDNVKSYYNNVRLVRR